MKGIKKILYSIVFISFLHIFLINNFAYADSITYPIEKIIYTPLYYIAVIVVISIVVGISILILRKICKSNQLEKEKNEKGEEDND